MAGTTSRGFDSFVLRVDTFTCAACGGTFDRDPDFDQTDAVAEFEDTFGRPLGDDYSSVCDDCYRDILAWAEDKGLLP